NYGEYKIINKSYEMSVYRFINATNGKEQNYYMVAELEDVDYRTITFEYDSENKATTIYSGIDASKGTMSAPVDNGGSNLSYSTTTSSKWTFELFSIEEDEELYEKFAEIKETPAIPGDIDGDGEVIVADATALIAMILDPTTATDAADIDGDGEILVADATALISIILGTDSNGAPAKAAATRAEEVATSTVSADGDGSTLLINISNPEYPFSAIQFDLDLPEGIEVEFDGEYYAVDLGSRTSSRKHSYPECAYQEDGSLRVVIVSMSNALYSGTEGDVATAALKVNGAADGEYQFTIKNVVISAPGSKEKLADHTGWITVTGGVTGIDSITADGKTTDATIYDLQGRKVTETVKGGIYIKDGKKFIAE
ncbi:MAG: dockerin type I repeat-containing protein, partial [Clostridia bacterium]|nr:dockerin type I repeat-containing protein [Clostridia bacterium]